LEEFFLIKRGGKKKDKANQSDDLRIMEPIVIRIHKTLQKHLGDELIVRYDSRCEPLESKQAFWFVLLVRPDPWQQVGAQQNEQDFV
jgi:hypothetical protein